jgi:hypothetical protein
MNQTRSMRVGPLMKIKLIKIFFSTFWLMAIIPAAFSAAEEYEPINTYDAWGVFKDERACWIATNADQAGDLVAEDQFAFVSFFYGDQIPEISFNAPDCCDDDVSAHSKDYVMPLFYFEDTLFPAEKDELDFLMSLLLSDSVEIVDDSSGIRLMSFPLLGFREAYNEVSRICEFRPMYLEEEGQNSFKG